MNALRVHDFTRAPTLDELPLPAPRPGEVRLRVQACGISCFDLLIASGRYQWRPPLPLVVGSEFAGVVEALGDGVAGRMAALPAGRCPARGGAAGRDRGGRGAEHALRHRAVRTARARQPAARRDGARSLSGFVSGDIGALRGNLTIVKGASLIGVDLHQYRERQPEAARRLLEDVAALHRDSRIRPRIAASFTLDRHEQAFALVHERPTIGRVLLRP